MDSSMSYFALSTLIKASCYQSGKIPYAGKNHRAPTAKFWILQACICKTQKSEYENKKRSLERKSLRTA